MRSRFLQPLLTLLFVQSVFIVKASVPLESPPGPLAGHWRLDADKSPDMGGWTSIELHIVTTGNKVAIARRYIAGRRVWQDTMELDPTSRTPVVFPVEWWPDNRVIAATIGGEKNKRVRASWLDGRRVLRLESDLVLSTQQGERPVNVLSDYKVSADGDVLTLVELRSSRLRPSVCTFKRIKS